MAPNLSEGHCIKAMMSMVIGEVVEARIYPDDASFGVAANTTSHLLVVCGGCNIAFKE